MVETIITTGDVESYIELVNLFIDKLRTDKVKPHSAFVALTVLLAYIYRAGYHGSEPIDTFLEKFNDATRSAVDTYIQVVEKRLHH